ncbi:trehalose 6-phosphate synthase [Sphingomonas laterariae]|uniref:Trehalose 6-phosphate synthase n=1 Tax=Edaphosphingomonas laterariae TaxID=861865 RepID=A0A239DS42_9SPHN|nr:trehalose-6-phosphate synthase [Sphingomonas laterariae]SNS34941.1 trehalose 6-phosphate synthase [Sphingomonas laterariae]
MSRLIVISNRVQPANGEGAGNQGGLAVALSAALRESNGIWFGWSGEEIETFTGQLNFQRHDGVATATVDLGAQDIEEYYNGFANRTLWPLFHYRIDVAEFERGFAGGYDRVNARFAETVHPLIEPDDLIWVHDYHMIPLGAELRARGVRNRIGFFLHIPWPPMRLLAALPNHRQLVQAMLAYDVIGFQTRDWLDSFLDYVRAEMPDVRIEADGSLFVGERAIRVIACPIGIDTAAFRASAREPEAVTAFERMRASANGRDLIVGVDRLDYSKGLQERFLGYERFLSSRPQALGRVFLLQIAPPSREDVQSYREIRSALDGLSGRINGEFADVEWVPIRYVNRGYPRDRLAGIYRAARVGLVTPLRDGMNLVAKEYVAAQDEDDPGVLILSRFAGAAEQMGEALLVNPHSAEEIADAISQALAMTRAERQRRWRALMDGVEERDVLWWQRCFLSVLASGGKATVDA